ncbi:hypothetical protein FRC09_003898 [Ceratobasidium sp. 395]|nr:hypothetical protein FRC09_003898 [Ceratobasidium sp. 395]
MISPWMELGSVNRAIRINPDLDRYRLCKQLAAAIKHLHEVENVIHGDIKGDNVLMASDGTLKLTDFGLAIMHDKTLQFSQTDPGRGTTRWMAPELYDGAQRCRESDIYAMGMTMLEMLTGKQPFHEIRGGDPAIIKAVLGGRTPDVSELDQRPISPRAQIMVGTLHRCWIRDAKERATATEVLGLDLSPEQDADILLLGCGDPRNILYTTHADVTTQGSRNLDITCCDMEPAVLEEQEPGESMWDIFFHFKISKAASARIGEIAGQLSRAALTIGYWRQSKWASYIKMVDLQTLAALQRHWKL